MAEGALNCKHLVHHCAKGKNICTRISRLTSYLFGCHVAGGAHDGAGRGMCAGHRHTVGLDWLCYKFRQTEVENFYSAIFGDEQILRLQVTVHDALLVSGSQTLRDLNSILD